MDERHSKTVAFPGGQSWPLPFEKPGGAAEPVGDVPCVALCPQGAAPVTLGTILFRYQGGLRMAVIAKAAFSMTSSPMTPQPAPPIHTRDVHHRGESTARVIVASDLVPGRTRVDVTLDGYAQTAFGVSLTGMTVRLLLEQHGAAVIDKRLRIVGADGAPFASMPVGYEHATRGEGAYATPIGVSGHAQAIVRDPLDRNRAAGFGPFAETWPVRRNLLTSAQLERIHSPVMDVASDLDWRYFQTAPPDQQVDDLAAHATITIAGFDATKPRVSATLPDAIAKGVIFGLDPANPELATRLSFRADSVHIHANTAECVVCWRAVLDVPSEAIVPTLLVAAGVRTAFGEVELPSTRPARPAEAEPMAPAVAPEIPAPTKPAATNCGTASITDDLLAAAMQPLPFLDPSTAQALKAANKPLPFIDPSTLEALSSAPPWIVAAAERGDGTGTAVPTSAPREPLPFKSRRDLREGHLVLAQLAPVHVVQPPWAPSAPTPAPAAPPAALATPPAAPPIAATPKPEPIAATLKPEPIAATPKSEPIAATPKPEPIAATPKPEPIAATPKPATPSAATPKPEPEKRPAERVIRVSNPEKPPPKKAKPKKSKRVRRVSEGTDLNALLYGKKS